jgi:hypothetical protein
MTNVPDGDVGAPANVERTAVIEAETPRRNPRDARQAFFGRQPKLPGREHHGRAQAADW